MYPALAVLEAWMSSSDTVLWVGGQGGMEADLVARQGIPYRAIPAAGVHGVGLRALPRNLWLLLRGVFAAGRIVQEFKPDVLLFTGGFIATPMAIAAARIPTLLYVPDIEPGLALKFLTYFADAIGVTVEASCRYFSSNKKVIVTGYPVRADLTHWSVEKARKFFELESGLPTLLVSGGSKGAHSINSALFSILPEVLEFAQVIHLSGKLDWEAAQATQANLPENITRRYHPFPYLHAEMGAALRAADLALTRAGASTLGELPLFGLPAILVPYPYAWRYQKVNADYLAKLGAAVLLPDQELQDHLLEKISSLLQSQKQLQSMRRAMQSLAHPQASSQLADLLRQLGGTFGGTA